MELKVEIPHSEILALKDILANAISIGITADVLGSSRKESIDAKDAAVYKAFEQLNTWLAF